MKIFMKIIVLLVIVIGIYIYKEPIAKFLTEHLETEKKVNDSLVHNQYFENKSYRAVAIAEQFTPQNKQDIVNIFYTVLNAGMKEFTFYCSDQYTDCIKDVDTISNNRVLLSNINNFVNPYNTFQDIETTRYDSTGKVTIKVNYTYTPEKIEQINQKIDEILSAKIQDTMSLEEKIKVIHDYIIENTKYDSDKSDNNINQYQSSTAYGPLFEGYGLCSGYADTMKLFLTKLNVPNIKISSENHIWNLVFLNDRWLHLDLTWDDPVLESGKEIIDYDYYLITTEELHQKNDNQHFFDKEIYKEAA